MAKTKSRKKAARSRSGGAAGRLSRSKPSEEDSGSVRAEPLEEGELRQSGGRSSFDEQVLLEYINTAKRSALPPRLILLFIVFVCVVAFFACWNSRGEGWVNKRIATLQAAIRWLGKPPPGPTVDVSVMADYLSAVRVLQTLHPEGKEDLQLLLSELEKARTNFGRIIRVPVLGVVFDVNDVGIFSGITLVISLVVYQFSFRREVDNIELAFFAAQQITRSTKAVDSNRFRSYCYELLSMSQVAVVPPSSLSKATPSFHLRHATKVALLLPALVQLYILINDLQTYVAGMAMSTTATMFVLMGNVSSLVLILLLTYSGFGVWLRLEVIWENEWNSLTRDRDGSSS